MEKYRIRHNGFNYSVEMKKWIGWSIFKRPIWVSIRSFWELKEAMKYKYMLKKLNQ